jgi:alpha-tubulin suppressor-like RCC1 family protein
VHCWGDDRAGQLADNGQRASSSVPVSIAIPRDVVQVSASLGICALLGDSTVTCWGRYVPGGAISTRKIVGLVGVAAMAPRFDDHVCVLMNDGSVRCWDSPETPFTIAGLGPASTLAVAVGFGTSCALLADHTVVCWGDNSDGQLGDGGAEQESSVPVPVSGLTGVVGVAMSSSYACATKSDGTAMCWGNNESGTLGNGMTLDSNVPVPVSALTNVIGIAPAQDHACAQLADGTFACWGANLHGGLGVSPSMTPSSTTPIVVPL